MNWFRKTLSTLSFLVLFGATPAIAQQDKPLEVVASFSILGDVVGVIGGDAVTVTTLVGPDMDSHVYEPTPKDARALSKSQMLFVVGLGFEGWAEKLAQSAGYQGRIVQVSEGVKIISAPEDEAGHDHHGHDHGHDHGPNDPHIWQDVGNMRVVVKNIANALAEAVPDKAAGIRARAKAYDAELDTLDVWIKKQVEAIPQSARTVITSHDAFGYFAKAYGLKFVAPQGINTESEPSATDVARLVDQIKAQQTRAVFVENMASPRLIEQIAADTGARMGGKLYADALSKSDGPAPTYIDMMRHNTNMIVEALK